MSHNKESDKLYEVITPEEIFRPLGKFDLDPCAAIVRPWTIGEAANFTIEDDGLKLNWGRMRAFVNPPFGRYAQTWVAKMNEHRNGVVLIPSRTGTPWFHRQVYERADAIFYLEDRIWYRDNNGNYICDKKTGKPGNCGHDSVLIPYGRKNIDAITDSGLKGHMEYLRCMNVVVVTSSGVWRTVITRAISSRGGEAHVQDIYEVIEIMASDKTRNNKNWKAKVRQQLQYHFTRVDKGKYSAKDKSLS